MDCIDADGKSVEKSLCQFDEPRQKETCYSTCDQAWFLSDWSEQVLYTIMIIPVISQQYSILIHRIVRHYLCDHHAVCDSVIVLLGGGGYRGPLNLSMRVFMSFTICTLVGFGSEIT